MFLFIFSEIFTKFSKELWVMLISMVPVIELRGAIPVGCANGLSPVVNFIFAVIGNMLPVPIILFLFTFVLEWMKKCKIDFIRKPALWIEKKLMRGSEKVEKYKLLGLFILVAIPLPGTGAWTGAGVAAILGLKFKHAFPMILLGVIAAGIVVTLISYGVLGSLNFLLG